MKVEKEKDHTSRLYKCIYCFFIQKNTVFYYFKQYVENAQLEYNIKVLDAQSEI